MFGFFKRIKRKALIKKPFPEKWRTYLKENLSMYNYLSKNKRKELEDHTKILLSEKYFIGAKEFEIDDHMKVLICAQAAILLLGRKAEYFPHVETIILYPSTFVSRIQKNAGGNFYLEEPEPRIGEFCQETREIVFSWQHIVMDMKNPKDGHNVILHEFAHQLDSESGAVNGTPLLPSFLAYRRWCETMTEEYKHLKKEVAKNHKTFIDDYATLSPAEFFAVLTEVFFEQGIILKQKHPNLYKILVDFYQQDPIQENLNQSKIEP